MKQGTVLVEDVPAPLHEEGSALIKVSHSCISTGTELSGMKEAAVPLWRKAIKNPDNVRKALTMLATKGYSKTESIIQGKLKSGFPVGYSAAGTIIGTSQKVACAGAQCANHAEIMQVPENLMVAIPENLSLIHISEPTRPY